MIEFFENSVLEALIGAFIGIFLPVIFNFLKFIFYGFWKKHRLEGEWFAYHYTYDGHKLILRKNDWKIRKNLYNSLVITSSDSLRAKLVYQGKVETENNFLLITLSGRYHKEKVQFRIFEPIPSSSHIMYGFFVALDFNLKPYCSIALISRKELNNKVIKSYLSKIILFDKRSFAIRIAL